jgi:uncharacterized damage-inducible protein DinB
MQKYFQKLFEFEHWSNQTILDSLRSTETPNERALFLFSHLLSSHSMWLSRVNKTEFTTALFQERTLDECEALMQQNLEGWRKWLDAQTNTDWDYSFEFMGLWENPPRKRRVTLSDALTHILQHSAYHRGQIVVHIKGTVHELPLSTYIVYAGKVIEA